MSKYLNDTIRNGKNTKIVNLHEFRCQNEPTKVDDNIFNQENVKQALW